MSLADAERLLRSLHDLSADVEAVFTRVEARAVDFIEGRDELFGFLERLDVLRATLSSVEGVIPDDVWRFVDRASDELRVIVSEKIAQLRGSWEALTIRERRRISCPVEACVRLKQRGDAFCARHGGEWAASLYCADMRRLGPSVQQASRAAFIDWVRRGRPAEADAVRHRYIQLFKKARPVTDSRGRVD